MKYVSLIGVPGAMINFLSRAISLSDRVFWEFNPNGEFLNNLSDKLEEFDYTRVMNKSYSERDWEEFEIPPGWYVTMSDIVDKVEQSKNKYSSDSVFIHEDHPSGYSFETYDENYIIFINHQQCAKWVKGNAIYKNSSWDHNERVNYNFLKEYALYPNAYNLYELDLSKIIHGNSDMFLQVYCDICNHLGIDNTRIHIKEVNFLYKQWFKTSLKENEIDDFLYKHQDLDNAYFF